MRAAIVGACLVGSTASVWAQRPARPTRVLVLYGIAPDAPSAPALIERLRSTIRTELSAPVEFYVEYLDLDRFPDPKQSLRLASYLGDKYSGFGVDIMIAAGSVALQFATEKLREELPGIPVVFGLAYEHSVDPRSLPANVTGRVLSVSLGRTLSMARRLQPDLERVFVIAGSSAIDSLAIADALGSLGHMRDSIHVVLRQGVPFDELRAELRNAPPRSVVFFAHFRRDGRGRIFVPQEAMAVLGHDARVPSYGFAEPMLNLGGILGGAMYRHTDEGTYIGNLAVRVLRAPRGAPLPPVERVESPFIADWRELRRFNLSEQSLPPGTDVRFRSPTTWERYRGVILTTLVVIVAQATLIGALLVQRRARRRAAIAAAEAQRQVAHLGRVATVGELGSTISHELRQPLTAIRVNAEVGLKLLEDSILDVAEARQAMQDVLADAGRASETIEQIRLMLSTQTPITTALDLNAITEHVGSLLQRDASMRKVRLDLELAPELPRVRGNAIELQQAILNLALNSFDAVTAASGPRAVVIRTTAMLDLVEVSVRDTGPGFSEEVRTRLFDPFFTTKEHGLGMGLAIVRTLVEQHGGSVVAENLTDGGAIVRLILPTEVPSPNGATQDAAVIAGAYAVPLGRGEFADVAVLSRAPDVEPDPRVRITPSGGLRHSMSAAINRTVLEPRSPD